MGDIDSIGRSGFSRDGLKQAAFIGTYLPRRCGIATFTSDLLEAVALQSPETDAWCIALNDRPEGYRYPDRVKFEINERRLADYRLAADYLNAARVDVVCLQHEYGIFSGREGEQIIQLLNRLRVPVVTTLHTVLEEPSGDQRRVLVEIARLSDRLVVMADRAVTFLQEIYGVSTDKIVHIPHGIPDVPFIDPSFYKDQFDVEGKKVILTFGLLGPGKGIEAMIDAMPLVIKKHPDAVYIVLGATHPHVQATYGEDYRTALGRRAAELGVQDHVIFHNRFVQRKELCEFLGVADVYVTPYLNRTQIVSGTLAYALGAGNAVVSTPYWYAQELLAEGRGRLVPFRDPRTLAATIIELFDNETLRHAMRKRGYLHTRDFVWSKVADQYLQLFAECGRSRHETPRPAPVRRNDLLRKNELPELRLDHLLALTDGVSVVRHAKGDVPDWRHGYSTDDTARALTAVLKSRDHMPSGAGCTMLIRGYLAYLNYAFDSANGRFRNYMSYDRRWAEDVGSEDSHGRAVWALGETVARAERKGHSTLAVQLFHQAVPAVTTFTSPRAWAFALLGIHAYLRRYSGDTEIKRYRTQLADKLANLYASVAEDDWLWPEPYLAYENAHLPHALMLCGQWMFESNWSDLALRSLRWLLDKQTSPQGHFTPIGADGYYQRGQTPARFDQLPLEAYAMIDACLEAHRMTRQDSWLDAAFRVFYWFLGDNDMRLPLYDPHTSGCCDGLHPNGVNENQGAQATTAWLLALSALYEYGVGQSEPTTMSVTAPPESTLDQPIDPPPCPSVVVIKSESTKTPKTPAK